MIIERLKLTIQQTRPAAQPAEKSHHAGGVKWQGASWGGLAALLIILVSAAFGMFGEAGMPRLVTGAVFLLAAFAFMGIVLTSFWYLLRKVPIIYVWVLTCAVLLLALMALTAISAAVGIILAGLGLIISASLLGAGLSCMRENRLLHGNGLQRVQAFGFLALGVIGLTAGGSWLLDDGSPQVLPPNAAKISRADVDPLNVSDPSQPGPYTVRKLYYGSGADKNRRIYGTEVDIVTQPVDGSAFIEGWSGFRTAFWGFDPHSLPLNGMVWYPERENESAHHGPFPLVLIVHGQHPMEDFSEGGYAYLGELLASRGYIAAAVDENFLNLSPLANLLVFHSLVGENDLRGWLLLEHLSAWRKWNGSPDSVFYQKVDMDQIALVGHSRGGEAIITAAVFNQLPASPDNASIRFDYHFQIRSLVGIAPVEGTFQPAGQQMALENVNYLVLHGVHDMDVFTFQGNRQYERISFNDGGEWFKSAVYIYGANHGQFNTDWGRKDLYEPIMRVFNLEQLMSGEEQRRTAAVTISAFLDATLYQESEYRAFFQDVRRGKGWLPSTIYLNQYQDSNTQMVSTYEEDIDLTTISMSGGRAAGEHLTIWREQPLAAKWKTLENQAVTLGWKSTDHLGTPVYAVQVPQGQLSLNQECVLVFSMADANMDPLTGAQNSGDASTGSPIDLTVEVVDRAGETARLPLSQFSLLQRQLESHLGKAAFFSPFPASEAVLQHFEYPLEDFVRNNPDFQPEELTAVRFLFDRTSSGVVFLDAIGFRNETAGK